MGIDFVARMEDNGVKQDIYQLPLSTTFLQLVEVLRKQMTPAAKTMFEIHGYGEEKELTVKELVTAIQDVLEQLSDNRNLTSYYFTDDLKEGYARGQNGMVNGKAVSFDGGLGECWMKVYNLDKYQKGKKFEEMFEEIVDLRDRDFIDTDNGRLFIVKKKARKMLEVKAFKELLVTLNEMDGASKVSILFG